MENSMEISLRARNKTTIWVSNPTTEDVKTIIQKDTCTPIFIAELFTIVRTWKQPRCPSTGDWIKKLWYIYTMEYDSAIKRDDYESVIVRWMSLEPVLQSEVSQKEKDIPHMCMESRKMVQWPYFQGRNRDADVENGRAAQQRKWTMGHVERVALTYKWHKCKMDSSWETNTY